MKKIINTFILLISFVLVIPSFAINNKPAKESNVEIIQNLYAAFAIGDVPAVLQNFDPKIVWNEAENFPYADRNPYVGPQAVLEGVFARIGAEWEYWNLTDQTYYEANSGEIIVTGRYNAKNKLTGKEISVQFVHMWTLNEGLVTKFQQYADTYQAVEAMK
ncbi:MAG TPA: nuclear transport factor 2 family protein [Ignavibacteriaceae bacterium]